MEGRIAMNTIIFLSLLVGTIGVLIAVIGGILGIRHPIQQAWLNTRKAPSHDGTDQNQQQHTA